MPSLKVYGASDDLVEIDGDIYDEFQYGDRPGYLAFNDGTVLHVEYNSEGIWRINLVNSGTSFYTKQEAADDDGKREDGLPAYSDIVTLDLDSDWHWAVYGEQRAKRSHG